MKHLNISLMAVAVAAALAGCNGNDGGSASDTTTTTTTPAARSISFGSVPVPATEAEKRAVSATSKATVNGKDYNIGYNTIMRSGDQVGGGTFGLVYDSTGTPLTATDGSLRVSDDNDFASLLPVGGKLFMVSHFETRPAAMYLTELSQDKTSGKLTAVQTRNLDFSAVHGGWVHCAGSVTPWNTHLGSEEYPPDARAVNPATGSIDNDSEYYNAMAAYYGGNKLALNAYDYGYQVEVKVNSFDSATVTKHYTMGRIAHELGKVMPDNKTVYMSDDGGNGVMLRFVADKAGDLSSGELFAAKWTQTSKDNGGAANLSWVSLGKATDAEVKTYLDSKLTFADMFDAETANADGSCPTAGFTHVATGSGTTGINGVTECLKLKTGMEKAASRLETRRYAALKGATTEFNKMEGITLDQDSKTMYMSMSSVEKSMLDNDKTDLGGPNDIRLDKNSCGTVFGLKLDDNYAATSMAGVVPGKASTTGDAANTCDLNGVANPDNVTYMPGYKTLIIGEDTGTGHQNDAIWSYNTESKALTRILTTPYGSETTSPYFYPDINGWAYLMAVVQHPYGESDQSKLVAGSGDNRAYTGYIGPLPSMK
ncbi:alkaline phosphatase PhoX [Candidatus Thiothrix sp. Deng01]|uniref:Alkaline phosphatase PhoX n=1 Tax=Candidatus Thiothrix phosphatis TaxID=3112415 RepID=A0ABU6CXA4_9GAMM|nr:alkaline phosphatase PhoX [Candidatus Thiothrix sp. Deng01]MEB4591433.1 alkaline phosphatase PhoX [Candidatus Thiothrix sp. Deng01]